MKNEELFKNFVLEIEKVKSMPNNNYYDSLYLEDIVLTIK